MKKSLKFITLICILALCIPYIVSIPSAAASEENSSGSEESYVTREQFCEMLWEKAIRKDINNTEETKILMASPFTDTSNISVYMLWSYGIVLGTGGTTFEPDDFITHEQCALLLFRTVKYLKLDTFLSSENKKIIDIEDVSEWAEESVLVMYNSNIINIAVDGKIYPDSYINNDYAETMISNVNSLKDKLNIAKESFYKKLLTEVESASNGNYCISPLSIKMAISLALNGAAGETYNEIEKALGITDIEELNKSLNNLMKTYGEGNTLIFDIANSIWLNEDKSGECTFKDSYKKTLLDYYSAKAGIVNDKNALEIINKWVSENTNELIRKILSDNDFGAALINALYFKGSWEKQFDPAKTTKEFFNNSDGTKTKIDFMNNTDYYNYYESENGVRVIELKYLTNNPEDKKDNGTDKSMSMFVILGGNIGETEEILNEAEFKRTNVSLSIPKFKIETSSNLSNLFKNLGIYSAFDKTKPISQICSMAEICI